MKSKVVLWLIMMSFPIVFHAQSSETEAEKQFNKGNYDDAAQLYDAAASFATDKTTQNRFYEMAKKCRNCKEYRTNAQKNYKIKNYIVAKSQFRQVISLNKNDKYAIRMVDSCEYHIGQIENEKIEKTMWDSISVYKTESLCQRYKSLFPKGKHIAEVNSFLNEYDLWNQTLSSNTQEAFQSYLDNTTKGFFENEAKRKIKEIEEYQQQLALQNRKAEEQRKAEERRKEEQLKAEERHKADELRHAEERQKANEQKYAENMELLKSARKNFESRNYEYALYYYNKVDSEWLLTELTDQDWENITYCKEITSKTNEKKVSPYDDTKAAKSYGINAEPTQSSPSISGTVDSKKKNVVKADAFRFGFGLMVNNQVNSDNDSQLTLGLDALLLRIGSYRNYFNVDLGAGVNYYFDIYNALSYDLIAFAGIKWNVLRFRTSAIYVGYEADASRIYNLFIKNSLDYTIDSDYSDLMNDFSFSIGVQGNRVDVGLNCGTQLLAPYLGMKICILF